MDERMNGWVDEGMVVDTYVSSLSPWARRRKAIAGRN